MGTFVTSSGFVGRTVQQVLTALNSAMQTLFGPAVDISPEGPTGQLLGLPAAGLGDVWGALLEVYSSMDPNQATGPALDRICAYTGVHRTAAAATTVNALLYTDAANSGVTIPAGSQARRVRGAVVFSLATNTVIAPGSCQDVYLSFATIPASGTTGITLTTTFGAHTITMPTVTDPTARAIAALELFATWAQATAWGTASAPVTPGVAQVWSAGVLQQPATDTLGGNQVTTGTVLRLSNVATAFGVTLTGTWTLQAVGAQGAFVCSATGPQTVNPNEMTSIVTPQTGWNGVTNLVLGLPGRDVETDTTLRIRRAQSLGAGLATESSMQAYIANNVAGVTSVSVTSNRTDFVDSFSAPAHSVTATVIGGATPDAVAQAIWDCMPAGIAANGNTSGTATDSQGTLHTISYNVPVSVAVWVKVLYDLYAEEQFPADGTTEIANAIVAWALTEFTPGKDVIAPRFLAPVYTVPGIGNVQVTISTDGTTFVAGPLTMGPGDVATVAAVNISFGVL
jgi:uncharacterized phage protein gp47/JayE